MLIYVYPKNDEPHEDKTIYCPCRPTLAYNGPGKDLTLIHHDMPVLFGMEGLK